MNPRLRLAIQAARAENMPKDNIERAIKKALGGDAENYEEIRYEGYGPGGVAVIVEALTDNRNRTAGAVRSVFTKNGGNLGETGSVSLHVRRTSARSPIRPSAGTADAMLEAAIEAGADDVDSRMPSGHVIACAFDDLGDGRRRARGEARRAEQRQGRVEAANTVDAVDEEQGARRCMKLIDALDDDDDVQNVYANFEVSDERPEEADGCLIGREKRRKQRATCRASPPPSPRPRLSGGLRSSNVSRHSGAT